MTVELPSVTVSEHEGVRYLHLGDTPWIQGAMLMRSPHVLVLEYVQRMMAWMLWRDCAALTQGRAVQLGLGAGAITRFCHHVLGLPHCTAVELNPEVIAACRHAFAMPPDNARLVVVQADAARWIAEAVRGSRIDALQVDLYDQEAAAPVHDSAAFYAGCHAALAPGGLLAVNLFGRHASFERSAACIVAAFGRDQVWRLRPTREGNTIVIAARGVATPSRETLLARAATIERDYGLPARKWLRLVQPC